LNPSKKIIAIVDDDFLLRKSLERLLQATGYRTESFASAEEFLDELPHCAADCLVVDLKLPGRSGLELLQHPDIVALKFPAILMSGTLDAARTQQALAAGCIACLRKPFKAVELLRIIVKITT
jgi:FixJ family two-component response regulator